MDMKLRTLCPKCQKRLKITDSAIGKRVRCPKCRQLFTIGQDSPIFTKDAAFSIGPDAEETPAKADREHATVVETPEAKALPTLETIGRFEVKDVIGQGAHGTVYRAYDPSLERQVALKIPKFEAGDEREAGQFRRAARAVANLQHPNIVAVFEIGQAKGKLFVASELIEGHTLETHLTQAPPDFGQCLIWMAEIARALAHAHERGVVHRDVKPQNVLVDRDGRAKLTDFGLARSQHAEVTVNQPGSLLGTPAYMSPEQARGESERIGPHSDQYALGVMIYRLLTGRLPFEGPAYTVIGMLVADQKPPKPRELNPDVPRALEKLCLRAMARNPSSRFPGCGELAAAIDTWLSDPKEGTGFFRTLQPGRSQALMTALMPILRRTQTVQSLLPGWVWITSGAALACLCCTAAVLFLTGGPEVRLGNAAVSDGHQAPVVAKTTDTAETPASSRGDGQPRSAPARRPEKPSSDLPVSVPASVPSEEESAPPVAATVPSPSLAPASPSAPPATKASAQPTAAAPTTPPNGNDASKDAMSEQSTAGSKVPSVSPATDHSTANPKMADDVSGSPAAPTVAQAQPAPSLPEPALPTSASSRTNETPSPGGGTASAPTSVAVQGVAPARNATEVPDDTSPVAPQPAPDTTADRKASKEKAKKAGFDEWDRIETVSWDGESSAPAFAGVRQVKEKTLGPASPVTCGLAINPKGEVAYAFGRGAAPGMGLQFWDKGRAGKLICRFEHDRYAHHRSAQQNLEAERQGRFAFFAGPLAFDAAGDCYFSLGQVVPNGVYKAEPHGKIERLFALNAKTCSLQAPSFDPDNLYLLADNRVLQCPKSGVGTPSRGLS